MVRQCTAVHVTVHCDIGLDPVLHATHSRIVKLRVQFTTRTGRKATLSLHHEVGDASRARCVYCGAAVFKGAAETAAHRSKGGSHDPPLAADSTTSTAARRCGGPAAAMAPVRLVADTAAALQGRGGLAELYLARSDHPPAHRCSSNSASILLAAELNRLAAGADVNMITVPVTRLAGRR
jgi:hypothetical protein